MEKSYLDKSLKAHTSPESDIKASDSLDNIQRQLENSNPLSREKTEELYNKYNEAVIKLSDSILENSNILIGFRLSEPHSPYIARIENIISKTSSFAGSCSNVMDKQQRILDRPKASIALRQLQYLDQTFRNVVQQLQLTPQKTQELIDLTKEFNDKPETTAHNIKNARLQLYQQNELSQLTQIPTTTSPTDLNINQGVIVDTTSLVISDSFGNYFNNQEGIIAQSSSIYQLNPVVHFRQEITPVVPSQLEGTPSQPWSFTSTEHSNNFPGITTPRGGNESRLNDDTAINIQSPAHVQEKFSQSKVPRKRKSKQQLHYSHDKSIDNEESAKTPLHKKRSVQHLSTLPENSATADNNAINQAIDSKTWLQMVADKLRNNYQLDTPECEGQDPPTRQYAANIVQDINSWLRSGSHDQGREMIESMLSVGEYSMQQLSRIVDTELNDLMAKSPYKDANQDIMENTLANLNLSLGENFMQQLPENNNSESDKFIASSSYKDVNQDIMKNLLDNMENRRSKKQSEEVERIVRLLLVVDGKTPDDDAPGRKSKAWIGEETKPFTNDPDQAWQKALSLLKESNNKDLQQWYGVLENDWKKKR